MTYKHCKSGAKYCCENTLKARILLREHFVRINNREMYTLMNKINNGKEHKKEEEL